MIIEVGRKYQLKNGERCCEVTAIGKEKLLVKYNSGVCELAYSIEEFKEYFEPYVQTMTTKRYCVIYVIASQPERDFVYTSHTKEDAEGYIRSNKKYWLRGAGPFEVTFST